MSRSWSLEELEARSLLATLTVTSTNDSGLGSLRQAILSANITPGLDTIVFSIGSGVKTIKPTSALPNISDPVVIDGTTQPGFSGTPIIELSGILAGANANGLAITAGNSTVRGLVIDQFSGDGILSTTKGGNLFEGNYIGTDPSGTNALGNGGYGVDMGTALSNTVGGTAAGVGNVISSNAQGGIRIYGDSFLVSEDNKAVRVDSQTGAVLATYPTGVPNGAAVFGPDGSLYVTDYYNNQVLHYDASGAPLPSFGAGQLNEPQNLTFGPDGTLYVGDAYGNVQNFSPSGTFLRTFISAGSGGLTNTKGVVFGPDGNVYVANLGNNDVLRYNGTTGAFLGVFVSSGSGGLNGPEDLQFGPDGNLYVSSYFKDRIERYNGTTGAFLGTFASGNCVTPYGLRFDAAGNLDVACRSTGQIQTYDGTTGTFLHNLVTNLTNPAWFATVPGNGSGDVIQGNFIGTTATGSAALPNLDGVDIYASNNTIGGTGPGAGNTIADNTGDGVVVAAGTGNAIEGNGIFANGGLGIELGNGGGTANTGAKNPALPNSGMNFPVFTSAIVNGTTLTVAGYVGTAAGQTTFAGARVEIFNADNDTSGQYQPYLGTLTTDASGAFSGSLTVNGLDAGDMVTGTATDATGNTSEFAANITTAKSADSSSTTLVSSATSSVYGQAVTFTATVSAMDPSKGPPTGMATFMDGVTSLGSVALTGGTAVFTTSILSAVSHNISVSYGGDKDFLASASNPLTQTVTPATLTVTADAASKVYGQANPAFTASYTGFVNGETSSVVSGLSLSSSATALSNVGTYGIVPSGASARNYSITYVNGPLTINPAYLTVTAGNQSKTYGAAMPALNYTESGLVNGDTVGVFTGALSSSATASTGVGSYAISQGSLSAGGNYSIGFTRGTLTINPATLAITADDESKTYGAAMPALTYTESGLVNGDTSSVFSGGLVTSGSATSNVGSYGITQGTLSAGSNYAIGFTSGTLIVNRAALSIRAKDQGMSYGAAVPAFDALYSGLVNGDTSGIVSGLSFSTSATTGSAVGTYAITPGGASASNYTISYANGTLTVAPDVLTVTADSQNKIYGAALPVLTYSYHGLVNGDTSSVFTGGLTTLAAPGSSVGNYGITQGTLSAGSNYAIGFTNGTLTVTPAALYVTTVDRAREYGRSNPSFEASYSGFVNGDTASSLGGVLGFSAGVTAGSPVGSYSVTPDGLTSSNYAINFVSGTLLVTPAPLTVTANDAGRIYGQANPAFMASYSGLVNGDTPGTLGTLSFNTTAGGASPVGSYLVTPSGLDASNYAVTYQPGTLSVTPALLVVRANDASRLFGQPNPAFVATFTGLVNGDTPGALGTLSFRTTATDTSPVDSYSVTPLGLSATNYAVTYQPGILTVTPNALALSGATVASTEGTTYTGVVATFTEQVPTGSPGSYSAIIEWGDGHASPGVIRFDSARAVYTVESSNTFEVAGIYATNVVIRSNHTVVATAAGQAVIADAPLLVAVASISATEGAPFQGVVGTFTDTGTADRPTDYRATISWGDGQTSSGVVSRDVKSHSFTIRGSNTYAAEGVYAVRVEVRAAAGAQETATGLAVVAAAPLRVIGVPIAPTVGKPFSGVVATISGADPSSRTTAFSVVLDWGDGGTSPGTVLANGPGSFLVLGDHTYAESGRHRVVVTVIDRDDAPTTVELTAIVALPTATIPVALPTATVPVALPTATVPAGNPPGTGGQPLLFVVGTPGDNPVASTGASGTPTSPLPIPGTIVLAADALAMNHKAVAAPSPSLVPSPSADTPPGPPPGVNTHEESAKTNDPAQAVTSAFLQAAVASVSHRYATVIGAISGPVGSASTAAPPPLSVEQSLEGLVKNALTAPSEYLWRAIDELGEQVGSGSTLRVLQEVFGVGAVAYAGYVLLQSRACYLLLSVLTAQPLWSEMDPLAVLVGWEKEKKRRGGALVEDDEETLQSLTEGRGGLDD